jgi:hypothetical protein
MIFQSITTAMVRQAMRGFCAGEKCVSLAQLYDVLDLQYEREKHTARARLAILTRTGEAVRVSSGLYKYNFKYRARENSTRPAIWRFVRSQKPGWSISYACQITRVSYIQVMRYILWLAEQGYIARHGKDGHTILYRATDKADQTPEPPYPPTSDRNPFEAENTAAARLAALMLCDNPYQPKVRDEIITNCNILLARFAGKNTEGEACLKK